MNRLLTVVLALSILIPLAQGYTYNITQTNYQWINITQTGYPFILASKAISTQISIGFSFKFYSLTYSNLYITSSGFITFTDITVPNLPDCGINEEGGT